MRFLKWFGVIAAIFFCFALPMKIHAADVPSDDPSVEVTTATTEAPLLTSPNLISTFRNDLFYENGMLDMIMTTSATGFVAEIGFQDIIVQKSSDNVHWSNSMFFGDRIEYDTTGSLFEMIVGPQQGYYYRVYVTHYAKEDAFFFPAEQRVYSYSNVVYVP